MPPSKTALQLKYLIAALAGALVALAVWKILALESRYAMAVVGGILVLCFAMMAIYRIEDFLLYALIFNIPFSRFAKWFFPQEEYVAAQGIMLGLAELLILLAYGVWFSQVFIAKKEPLPKIQRIDYFILLLIVAQVMSLFGASYKTLGFFDIIYNIKHFLIYFFIAHKVKRCHLKWIIVILLFAIFVESSLAFYERLTGNIGLGISKGNIAHDKFGTQPKVPGIEEIRAAGTTNDSHTLGLYYSLLLPIPFVLMTSQYLRPHIRLMLSCILIFGIIGLIITFSRSAWLGFAIAATFAMGIIIFSWKEFSSLFITLIIVIVVSFLYPQAYEYLFVRLFKAPFEILETRFEMNRSALSIWREHFLFGCGTANYTVVINNPNVTEYDPRGLPVHNVFLQLASEIGLFGVTTFYAILLLAIHHCWKFLKCDDFLIRGLALAILMALLAYILDGLTDPMFKSSVVYAQLWTYIALCVSFPRISTNMNPQVYPGD